ncbi:TetR/AcrR family transcriptional regulator [Microbacterium sp. NPDC064584]|uniref:TetR/AcrR family transcriptional regulator n=1 Tax=Microbacterium sp. NPDC064584 TaxID=3155817 RepID=UPI00341B5023
MSPLSTAESRRPLVTSAAVRAFARGGYRGTTIADVAAVAGISASYVSKLYSTKELLFVAALDECFDQILGALASGADAAGSDDSAAILDAMGDAYAELIADRDLLLLQVHAQSVADVTEIRSAMREGLSNVTSFAQERSRCTDEEVQQFIAFGQLCHLIVTLDLDAVPASWASALTRGIRHP